MDVIAFAGLRVKILYLAAGEFLVIAQVKIRTGMDALEFLEAEGELKLDVGGGVGIVGQFLVVVEAVLLIAQSEGLVPLQTGLFPLGEPLKLGTWTHEELHLHLLKLPHAEDELTGHYLVAEGLAYLGYSERNLHTACLLDIEEVDEYTLCCLGTQVDDTVLAGYIAELGGEHQVELTHLGPVLGT